MILPNLLSTPSTYNAQQPNNGSLPSYSSMITPEQSIQQSYQNNPAAMGQYLNQLQQTNSLINNNIANDTQRTINNAKAMGMDSLAVQALNQTRTMPSQGYYAKMLQMNQNIANNVGRYGPNTPAPTAAQQQIQMYNAQQQQAGYQRQAYLNPQTMNNTPFASSDNRNPMAILPNFSTNANPGSGYQNYMANNPANPQPGTMGRPFANSQQVTDYYTKPNNVLPTPSATPTGASPYENMGGSNPYGAASSVDPFSDIRSLLS